VYNGTRVSVKPTEPTAIDLPARRTIPRSNSRDEGVSGCRFFIPLFVLPVKGCGAPDSALSAIDVNLIGGPGVHFQYSGAESMNLRSRWVASGVVLVTVLVCYFGVRAELSQAHRIQTQGTPHFDTSATAELTCSTDPAGKC
jgi:hypothetical protein